jgi:hypothetical protein
MESIRVHKSGEDLMKNSNIGVVTDGKKVLIRGALIRIETSPGEYNEPNYKVSVWIPGLNQARQFEINTKSQSYSYFSAKDVFAALVEAATGKRPSNGDEKTTTEIFGLSVDIAESLANSKDTITRSIDPLAEIITLPKPEVKVETKVTVKRKGPMVHGHMDECTCWKCEDMRKEQATKEGTEPEAELPADLTQHPKNCNCYRCLQNDMGYY